jgi:hypothetical protein
MPNPVLRLAGGRFWSVLALGRCQVLADVKVKMGR